MAVVVPRSTIGIAHPRLICGASLPTRYGTAHHYIYQNQMTLVNIAERCSGIENVFPGMG